MITNKPVFGTRRLKRRLGWGKSNIDGTWIPLVAQLGLGLTDLRLVTVEAAICDEEQSKRAAFMLAYLGLFLSAIGLLIYGIQLGFPPHFEFMLPGVLVGVISITLLANKYMVFHVVSMDAEYVWLSGAGLPFLDSLPVFEGLVEAANRDFATIGAVQERQIESPDKTNR